MRCHPPINTTENVREQQSKPKYRNLGVQVCKHQNFSIFEKQYNLGVEEEMESPQAMYQRRRNEGNIGLVKI
jgi:hypothetical protein